MLLDFLLENIKKFLKHLLIVFSYKSKISEVTKIAEMNDILKDNLYVSQNLPGIFLDVNALHSSEEEEHNLFKIEIAKLWNLFSVKPSFEFKLMEDIVDQLCQCHSESISDTVMPVVIEFKQRTKELVGKKDLSCKYMIIYVFPSFYRPGQARVDFLSAPSAKSS